MKKIVRLTESDLIRIVKRVIIESEFSPNVIKYSENMMGDENPFRGRRIPRSKFREGDKVVSLDGGSEGIIMNTMFDHDNNQHIYDVRFRLSSGASYRRDVSDDEIELIERN